MCGIVGLLIKNPALRGELGAWMQPMMVKMGDRGPDSAGLAVFTQPVGGERLKFSLYAGGDSGARVAGVDWNALATQLIAAHDPAAALLANGNHAIATACVPADTFRQWLTAQWPQVHLLSAGRAIDVYKDIGHPREVVARYGLQTLSGTHLVGHTRMATESAVTPAHAHPFTAGTDFCLVHNGSLSNPYSIRRKLEPLGIVFETDNDTEAACRYLEWRMREGDDLEAALARGFEELDGFYTFLMGTHDKLALVRDTFACKPAIVAETDDYVAISSEFRSLAHLPGVAQAKLFEPKPQQLYVWKV
jgi:methylamine---glutamate N-methyltransferase subunit A